jgi:ComF family protein
MVLFPYTGKYHRLLGAYKFGKNLALGNFFAEKIREALASASQDTVIVPVPPRSGKIRKTGWDQVEYLAALLEKGRGSKNMPRKSITIKNADMRVSRCLRRLPSKVQKELNQEERKKNLQGRIILKGAAPKTVVLIDDVITTGSTLDACAAVLKEGGAEKVYGLCLFYT